MLLPLIALAAKPIASSLDRSVNRRVGSAVLGGKDEEFHSRIDLAVRIYKGCSDKAKQGIEVVNNENDVSQRHRNRNVALDDQLVQTHVSAFLRDIPHILRCYR